MTSLHVSDTHTSPAIWIKIAAAIGVLWYAFGLAQFWLGFAMDTASAVLAGAITADHAAAIEATPVLIWTAFALASLMGLVGAILLFVSASRAKICFAVSVVAALIYYVWVYGLSGTGGDRPSEEAIIAVVVVLVTVGFTFLSSRLARR